MFCGKHSRHFIEKIVSRSQPRGILPRTGIYWQVPCGTCLENFACAQQVYHQFINAYQRTCLNRCIMANALWHVPFLKFIPASREENLAPRCNLPQILYIYTAVHFARLGITFCGATSQCGAAEIFLPASQCGMPDLGMFDETWAAPNLCHPLCYREFWEIMWE